MKNQVPGISHSQTMHKLYRLNDILSSANGDSTTVQKILSSILEESIGGLNDVSELQKLAYNTNFLISHAETKNKILLGIIDRMAHLESDSENEKTTELIFQGKNNTMLLI